MTIDAPSTEAPGEAPADGASAREGTLKSLLFRLAALGLGLVLTLVAAEVVSRFLDRGAPPPPLSVAVEESHRGGGHLPHRRASPEPGPEARKFRILVIGDSFTWGAGVFYRDTYPRRLEDLLERMAVGTLDVELDTYTRPGWGTVQELEALELNPPRLKPDLILLGYCLNDAERPRREGNDDLEEPLGRRPPAGLSAFLYSYSYGYRRLRDRLESRRQRRAFERYYHGLYERSGWREAQAALDELRTLAAGWKVPVVAAVFPIFDQQLGASYGYAGLHGRAAQALRARGFRTVDLLPAYRGVDAQRLAVVPFTDPHPNELAHRIASQVLARFLLEEGLVPIDPQWIHWKSLDLTVTSEEGKKR